MSDQANIDLTQFLNSDPACSTEDGRVIATRAFSAGWDAGYNQGREDGGKGKITMEHARSLAETYDGGEGNHPLARHRDSMG